MPSRRAMTGFLVAATAALSGCGSPAPSPSNAPPAGTATGSQPVSPPVIGIGGCASRGCHAGPTVTPGGGVIPVGVSNAASHWLRHDPHGRAFDTLRGPKSQQIITRLGHGWGPAPEEPRCLACHATPTLANRPIDEVRGLLVEGVTCDACHTAPGRSTGDWLDPHKKGWEPGGLADSYQKHGMRWLGDAPQRAGTCVGCHVGAPAKDGLPTRDVTHDLIAAGHPRLNFEYLTYLAALPPHWGEQGPRPDVTPRREPAIPPGYEVHAWFAGQVKAAKAGLSLSADRASRKNGWPELADFSCYACHHDLIPRPPGEPGWRTPRTNALDLGGPGRLQWTGANVSDPLLRFCGDEFVEQFRTLRRRMSLFEPPTETVSGPLRKAIEELNPGPLRADNPRAGPDLAVGLRLKERHDAGELDRMDWDDAVQTYYALRSAEASRRRSGGDDSLTAALDRLKEALRLPRRPTANSPVGYDPRRVADTLAAVADAFER